MRNYDIEVSGIRVSISYSEGNQQTQATISLSKEYVIHLDFPSDWAMTRVWQEIEKFIETFTQ